MKSGPYKQPYQQEKDYLEELFLERLFGCCSTLVFKGGTALSKFYGSARFSDDLDFSVRAEKKEKDLAIKIDKMLNLLYKEIPTKPLRKINTAGTLKYELSIRGPLFATLNRYQHLKIEIGKNESLIEPPSVFRRNPKYSDLHSYIALVMSEREILAEKVVALLYRHNIKARDLYDLYFMTHKGTELRIGLVDIKMKERGHAFTSERFYKRINDIRVIWDRELFRLLPEDAFVSYDEARSAVAEYFKNAGLL